MNLYQKIDCPEYSSINQEILDWLDSTQLINTSTEFWNPIDFRDLVSHCKSFKSWLLDHKLLVHNAAITIGRSPGCCLAHVDTPPARFKLSWPISNTKGSWNRWFEVADGSTFHVNHLGGMSFTDYRYLREIHRCPVEHPMLIDAGIPHDVWFDETAVFPRIGMQCQLMKEPKSL